MSESLNLQKTSEAIAAKTAEQQTEQAPVMAYDMKNRIGDQETREATGASDEESGEVRDEALKKELFGDFFVDMAQYVSVDVRTDMAEQTDLYNKSLSFLNEKRIALKGKLRGEDALIASFSERIMEKIERKKDKILTDVKEGIKAELTGNPQIDAELMKALLDPVSELNDLIRTGGEIFESLEKAFGGNIGAGERQALLDKISITEGVPDEAFYDDVRIAQSILGDIRALQEENLKNTDALIAAENEEIERLTLQKDEIEGQIGEATGLLSEKNETDIRVKYDDATLDEYVPKSALGKISTFTDYKKNKVEGVGKAKAFFDKNKLRGKELKERMEKHVRRFLSARNGVTAESMAKFSNVLMESSGVLAMNTKNERVSEEQTRRMNLLKALYNAGDGDTIASLTIEARRLIRNTDKDDIPFGGEFYRAHPMAAKIIILRKLLYDMDSNALTGASEEYCGRIQALESNVSYLYGAIVSSDEYRLEVLKQKSAKLESEINTHLEKRELLLQRKAEKENTVKTVSGVKTGESEKEALHRKITGLQEREEERARQKRIEDSRKRIADLKKSIDKNNLHAIKSAQAVPVMAREPANSMDMGAAAYMDTLLKENLFKGLDGEDEAFFKKKITEQTVRKLQKENKKLEDCTPEEVCGLVKAFELMVNKFLEDKTIKSFLEDCR
ncbi:MAG: hypothetical protein K5655_01165, partial [Lachnospiraceae bacterium]|nr:hypothetical protein [Lachnospiraceae bacterium]